MNRGVRGNFPAGVLVGAAPTTTWPRATFGRLFSFAPMGTNDENHQGQPVIDERSGSESPLLTYSSHGSAELILMDAQAVSV